MNDRLFTMHNVMFYAGCGALLAATVAVVHWAGGFVSATANVATTNG
jgi:hypothetical protein